MAHPLSYEELLKAYQQLDENARTLVRTDLELQIARRDLDSQVTKLLVLNKLSDLIHTTRDSRKILQMVSQALVQDVGFEKAWILYDDHDLSAPLLVEYGSAPSERPLLLQVADHGCRLLRERPQEMMYSIDRTEQDSRIRGLLDATHAAELVLSPLHLGGKECGAIFAARLQTYPPIREEDLAFFKMLGRQMSIALDNTRMHREITEVNSALEDRVAVRSRELMEANTRLLELDRAKSNFISLVSHELRTPMTTIKGFVSLLLDFEQNMEPSVRRDYLRKVNDESDRLSRLISDLLNISRIESGRMVIRWQEIDLPELAQQVFDKQKVQEGVAVNYSFSMPAPVPRFAADQDKLEQILINLVANATRFTPPGQTVRVLADMQDDMIRLRVINPGEGIPFSHLSKVFDKFYRMENDVNRRNRGTGLGLSICRGLVDAHGGKIWAESELNKETTFTVLLPLNLEKLEQPQDESPNPIESRTERGG